MAHALLSPSAAHRWLHCTPSAVLASKVEDKGSTYAEEGTCAHALCALMVLGALGRPAEQERAEYEALKAKYDSPEMQECATMYSSLVLEKWDKARQADAFARIYIERRLDFSTFAPDSFGTADCVILSEKRMEIIDFKYGKGVEVSAENNPQMMIYALGAYDEFFLDYEINDVGMTIVQPRIGNLSEWTLPAKELIAWGRETLQPAAQRAAKGEGELMPGTHCRFCPVKATCSAIAYEVIDAWRTNNNSKLLPPMIIANVLKLIPLIEQWASAVKEYALAEALAGNVPEGFKLVEGRSVRVIENPEGLAETLSAISEDIAQGIYRPRELKSLTDLEKLVGKKRFNEMAKPYIVKPAGKPTLAPVTDKRQSISPTSSEAAALDFANS